MTTRVQGELLQGSPQREGKRTRDPQGFLCRESNFSVKGDLYSPGPLWDLSTYTLLYVTRVVILVPSASFSYGGMTHREPSRRFPKLLLTPTLLYFIL